MAFSTLRMAAVPPTSTQSHLSLLQPSHAQLPPRFNVRPFQVRCKGDSNLEAPKRLRVTRREAMICLTTLSVTGIGISSSPEIAEARNTKAEMRRKIQEKLEWLREKAGLSKRKENDKEKLPSIPPSSKKEKSLPLEPSPLPLPTPPQSLVEATLL